MLIQRDTVESLFLTNHLRIPRLTQNLQQREIKSYNDNMYRDNANNMMVMMMTFMIKHSNPYIRPKVLLTVISANKNWLSVI